jgi:hypothetical protein
MGALTNALLSPAGYALLPMASAIAMKYVEINLSLAKNNAMMEM